MRERLTAAPPVEYPGRFSGYTNYWQSLAWSWRQHGNLFLIGQPDVGRAIAQNQADIAEELGLPGLVLDEGFLDGWLRSKAVELDDPAEEALAKALERGDVLVWADPAGALGAKLLAKAPGLAGVRSGLGSHQARAAGYREIIAASLADGDRRLFAVLAKDAGDRRRFRGDPRRCPERRRAIRPPSRLVRHGDPPPQRHLPSRPSARGHRPGARPGQRLVHVQRLYGLPDAEAASGVAGQGRPGHSRRRRHGQGHAQPGHGRLWSEELRRAQDPGHADRGGVDQVRQGPRRLSLPARLRPGLRQVRLRRADRRRRQ